MKEKSKTITTTVYVANDGREFAYADACAEWDVALKEKEEKHQKMENARKILAPTIITELNDFPPFNPCGDELQIKTWRWFKLENKEQLDALRSLVGENPVNEDFITGITRKRSANKKGKKDITFPVVVYTESFDSDWLRVGELPGSDKTDDIFSYYVSKDLLYVNQILGILEKEGLATQIIEPVKGYYDNEKFEAKEKAIVIKLLKKLSDKAIAEAVGWRKEDVRAVRKELATNV